MYLCSKSTNKNQLTTMKALINTDQPEPLQITDLELPPLEPGQLRIRIKAAALNRRDQWIRVGKYPGIKPGVILGSDGCGVVEVAGSEDVAQWVGKDVVINPNVGWGSNPAVQAADYSILGMPNHGTFAEYVQVPADRLHEQPRHLNAAQAAALPLAGLTAYRALFTHGQASQGKKILVTGIGGGVAQFALLFAHAVGARVWVTSGDEAKLQKSVELGAVGGYNYRTEAWQKQAAAEAKGFDIIIDSTGGKQFGSLTKLLAPAGKLVFYGASAGLPESIDLFRLFWGQGTIQGSTMGNDAEFAEMIQFVTKHQLVPSVDSVTPLDQAISAFDKMAANQQLGKLVLVMS